MTHVEPVPCLDAFDGVRIHLRPILLEMEGLRTQYNTTQRHQNYSLDSFFYDNSCFSTLRLHALAIYI